MPIPKVTQRIIDALVSDKVLDELQAKSLAAHWELHGGRLTATIAEMRFADEKKVAACIGKVFGAPFVDLEKVEKDGFALARLDVHYCETHLVYPIKLKDKVLSVAMADPSLLNLVDEMESKTKLRIQVHVAGEKDILNAIARHYRRSTGTQTVADAQAALDKVRRASEPLESNPASRTIPAGHTSILEELVAAAPPPEALTKDELKRLENLKETINRSSEVLLAVRQLLEEKFVVTRKDFDARVAGKS